MTTTVYLSLGSNLGDRAGNLREAIRRLGALGTVTATSDLYESEPVEVAGEQPWYVNCVVALRTELDGPDLLGRALQIERDMGRYRQVDKAPRTIDIDIVFFGNSVIETPELSVPHPAFARRRFVLQPLAQIAPDFVDPRSKKTVRRLLEELPPSADMVRKFKGA